MLLQDVGSAVAVAGRKPELCGTGVQLSSDGASFAPPRLAVMLGRNFKELDQGTQNQWL